MPNLDQILAGLKSLVEDVGDFIRQESRSFDRSSIQLKGLNDLVSYVDKTAENMLVEGLSELLPEAGFITEEGTASHRDEAYKWIVDPLDGTTNFVHGLPVYAISIALTFQEEIVIGIVYELNRNECFYASSGEPAYCNDEIIKVSNANSLSEALLATGFPYHDFDLVKKYLATLDSFMQNTHGLRRLGSAAVDLAYVACGRFEGFFEYNLKPWDVAAGAFIVQQAGGVVTDFKGGHDFIFGKEILAANIVHNEMLKVIQQHW
ncbi:inositol monophosphatase family protein [Fulvivirgaceae bacterium BMA12]|uniref:Inositol-1-monophosphatase n=1 Tax=Agaribacillus aureus TaxID=3051825 RepID=A0ABT8LEH9_9BACT|nr:inositol monophosphatase family protein [Fulvivirgaceae bacterium BMA12]